MITQMKTKWNNGTETTIEVVGQDVRITDEGPTVEGGTRVKVYSPHEILVLVSEHEELNRLLTLAAQTAYANTPTDELPLSKDSKRE